MLPNRRWKKWICPLLMIAALWPAKARGASLFPGDPEGKGAVTARDAAFMLRVLNGSQAREEVDAALDLTQNGILNETDVLSALWVAAGKIPDPVKFVERISTGLLDETEFTRFSYGDPMDDGLGNYKDDSVSITVSSGKFHGSVYYVADIYLQDVRLFQTGYAGDGILKNGYVQDLAQSYDAVLAINGDYYTQRNYGPIIRNGEILYGKISAAPDLCVLGWDGIVTTLPRGTLDEAGLARLHPYQSWVFGPALLEESGQAVKNPESDVSGVNPRTVLGYYGPGHYAFMVVDGRQDGYSTGLTMGNLASLCQKLGFQAAYNLDGGRSSAMSGSHGLLNRPSQNGRHVNDILYIARSSSQ